MAPRRLILAMVLLLALSTVIAVLAPDPREQTTERPERTAPERGTTGEAEPRSPQRGETEAAPAERPEVVAEASVRAGGRPERVAAGPGQRLILEGTSGEALEIAIPKLGLTATVDRWAPAVFDILLPERRESLEVVPLSGGKTIARIQVR